MAIANEIAQMQFLQAGGVLRMVIASKMEKGEMPKVYEYQDYPKHVVFDEGVEEIDCQTDMIQGRGEVTKHWTEKRRKFRVVVVNSEEEEERVLSGGKPSAEIEMERQSLIARGRGLGLRIDSSWSTVRLRRELGEKLDNDQPANQMETLERKLADLKRMADMQAEIERLTAKLSGQPAALDEVSDIRGQLEASGVAVDKRWGLAKLREELERATAPGVAA